MARMSVLENECYNHNHSVQGENRYLWHRRDSIQCVCVCVTDGVVVLMLVRQCVGASKGFC